MAAWQKVLNLSDWRIAKDPKASRSMAEVFDFEDEHKLVRYRIGADFGRTKVTPDSLEGTAIHEMLHIRLHSLIEAVAGYGKDSEQVNEKEHEVIIVVTELLLALSKLRRG